MCVTLELLLRRSPEPIKPKIMILTAPTSFLGERERERDVGFVRIRPPKGGLT
jgi:hypothetical protein